MEKEETHGNFWTTISKVEPLLELHSETGKHHEEHLPLQDKPTERFGYPSGQNFCFSQSPKFNLNTLELIKQLEQGQLDQGKPSNPPHQAASNMPTA